MKKILSIVAVILVIGALFLLMQVDVPCEENPKMVMNGYCATNQQGGAE